MYYWWHIHHELTERFHQEGHYGPRKEFNSTFVFSDEVVHLEDQPSKDGFELSTIKVSTMQ